MCHVAKKGNSSSIDPRVASSWVAPTGGPRGPRTECCAKRTLIGGAISPKAGVFQSLTFIVRNAF